MTRSAHVVYFLSLAVWVGGLAALTAVVAPTLFRQTSRGAAGALFGPTLRAFGYVEMACAALLLVSSVVLWKLDPRAGWAENVRMALVAAMILLLFSYAFGVHPAIAEERARIASFETLPDGDPQRARFDRLHRWSVRLVGANLLAGLLLLLFSAATIRSSR